MRRGERKALGPVLIHRHSYRFLRLVGIDVDEPEHPSRCFLVRKCPCGSKQGIAYGTRINMKFRAVTLARPKR